MSDYYELLQVHPKADAEAITAAYTRLRDRYAADKLEGAADELVALARKRRDEIEHAYAVLSDPVRRATYDADLRAVAAPPPPPAAEAAPDGDDDDELIDYRPLPPAKRQPRPANFNPQPRLNPSSVQQRPGRKARKSQPVWLWPATIAGTMTAAVLLISLIITNGGNVPQAASSDTRNAPATLATPEAVAATPTLNEIINQFETEIVAARQVTQQVPDNPNAWINLGNALYDSVQVVRETQPDSPLYIERLPRWIEASDAYSKALSLNPANPAVRADLAASYCYYGTSTNAQEYVERGIIEARRAITDGPQDPRAMLNLGVCLVADTPPQTAEALTTWKSLLSLTAADPGVRNAAQQLINVYER